MTDRRTYAPDVQRRRDQIVAAIDKLVEDTAADQRGSLRVEDLAAAIGLRNKSPLYKDHYRDLVNVFLARRLADSAPNDDVELAADPRDIADPGPAVRARRLREQAKLERELDQLRRRAQQRAERISELED